MKIKELLTDESKWIQGSFARDKNGDKVMAWDKSAVSWCLLGAFNMCYPTWKEKDPILDKLIEHFDTIAPSILLISWNDKDGRRFDEVKELLETLDI
jgi:hypothetical protein